MNATNSDLDEDCLARGFAGPRINLQAYVNWLSVGILPLQSVVDIATGQVPCWSSYEALCDFNRKVAEGQTITIEDMPAFAVDYRGSSPYARELYLRLVQAIEEGRLTGEKVTEYRLPTFAGQHPFRDLSMPIKIYWLRASDLVRFAASEGLRLAPVFVEAVRELGIETPAPVATEDSAGGRAGTGDAPATTTVAPAGPSIDKTDRAILRVLTRTPGLMCYEDIAATLPKRHPLDRRTVARRCHVLAGLDPPLVHLRSRKGAQITVDGKRLICNRK